MRYGNECFITKSYEKMTTQLPRDNCEQNEKQRKEEEKEKKNKTFRLDEDYSQSKCIYISRFNRTRWLRENGKWKCALCLNTLELCRGCEGMNNMYVDCSGISCGAPFLLCPNCVCLRGPDTYNYHKYHYFKNSNPTFIEFDSAFMTGWKESMHITGTYNKVNIDDSNNSSHSSIPLSFITFEPNEITNLQFVDADLI